MDKKDDFVIICGDFGGVWNKDCESKHDIQAVEGNGKGKYAFIQE